MQSIIGFCKPGATKSYQAGRLEYSSSRKAVSDFVAPGATKLYRAGCLKYFSSEEDIFIIF